MDADVIGGGGMAENVVVAEGVQGVKRPYTVVLGPIWTSLVPN